MSGPKTIEGGPGTDQLNTFGDSSDDLFHVGASGPRVRITRNLVDPLDIGGTEIVSVDAALGADRIVTSDLAGTAATLLEVKPGQNDLKPDTVFVNGTSGADNLRVTKFGLVHTISGQSQNLIINAAEPIDRLQLNGGSGDDTLDAGQMGSDQLETFIDGGPGKDTITGSPGEDEITGGQDADACRWAMGSTPSRGPRATETTSSKAARRRLPAHGRHRRTRTVRGRTAGVRTRVTNGSTVVDLGASRAPEHPARRRHRHAPRPRPHRHRHEDRRLGSGAVPRHERVRRRHRQPDRRRHVRQRLDQRHRDRRADAGQRPGRPGPSHPLRSDGSAARRHQARARRGVSRLPPSTTS